MWCVCSAKKVLGVLGQAGCLYQNAQLQTHKLLSSTQHMLHLNNSEPETSTRGNLNWYLMLICKRLKPVTGRLAQSCIAYTHMPVLHYTTFVLGAVSICDGDIRHGAQHARKDGHLHRGPEMGRHAKPPPHQRRIRPGVR